MSDIGIKDQCFGVEVEMTGITREEAAQALADYFGTVNANHKMSIFAGMECHFSPVSMRWVCSLDYPLLAGLKPVKS